MAARLGAFDWAGTPLGAKSTWPRSLTTLVDLVLEAGQPMFLAWGPARTWIYNDAFAPILGKKHPEALGQPAMQVWAEARADLEPMFDRVFAGEAVHLQGFSVGLDRHGTVEEAHFNFSYTPARDDDGAIAGLFGVCTETTELVQAQRRQADTIERERRQFQQAPGFVIVMTGPDHVVDFVNDKHRDVFGSGGWLGKPIREAFPSLEGQGFFELLDRVYATGEPFQADRAEVRYRRAGADEETVAYLSFVYAPITDETGTITGVFCSGFDATESVHSARALAVNDLRQALLVDLADAFRDLSDPGELSYAAAELLGKAFQVSRAGYGTIDTRAETIRIERDWNAPGVKSLAGLLHFRDYGSYIEDLKRGTTVVIADAEQDPRTTATAAALKAISAQSFVNMPVTEQGGLVALLYLNHAHAREWSAEELAVIREVAERTRVAVERRRAEDELRHLAASLERQVAERTQERDRVWKHSRDLLVVIGADGIFRAVNPAWTEILGHPVDQVVGRSFLEFVWRDDADRTRRGLDKAVAMQDLTNFENRYAHRDGTPRWISWHTAVEGETVFAYGRDITAGKKAEAELVVAQEALRQAQKMEAVGQLTGGIAHDFNNLLQGITVSLQLIKAKLKVGRPEGLDRYIDMGQDSVRRAAALTQRLLAFSRRQTLDPKPTDVNRLVSGMEELIRRSVGPAVEVEVIGAGGLWPTLVDPSQLENSLLNLCINARDAMPDGGRLTIETANKWLDERAAKERELAPGQYISLCVTDTGTGMPADVVARVFDPFFTTKPIGQGTGLGLSMVYGFVRQSGGQVRIYSEVGRGTTMGLYLPRHSGEAGDSATLGAAPASERGDGETVLVIEDEGTVRALIAEVLEEAGYRVIVAPDGPSGLRAFESAPRVDLLVTDVGLPGGMNGRQVADAARVIRPALKILFITGYAENAAVGNGLLERGMAVITKPFEVAALVNKVRDIVESRLT